MSNPDDDKFSPDQVRRLKQLKEKMGNPSYVELLRRGLSEVENEFEQSPEGIKALGPIPDFRERLGKAPKSKPEPT